MVDLGILGVTFILWAKCYFSERIYGEKMDGGFLLFDIDVYSYITSTTTYYDTLQAIKVFFYFACTNC